MYCHPASEDALSCMSATWLLLMIYTSCMTQYLLFYHTSYDFNIQSHAGSLASTVPSALKAAGGCAKLAHAQGAGPCELDDYAFRSASPFRL